MQILDGSVEEDGARFFSSGIQGMDEGQRAQTEIQEIPLKHKKSYFIGEGWSSTGRDCPERLWHVLGDAPNPTEQCPGQPAVVDSALSWQLVLQQSPQVPSKLKHSAILFSCAKSCDAFTDISIRDNPATP